MILLLYCILIVLADICGLLKLKKNCIINAFFNIICLYNYNFNYTIIKTSEIHFGLKMTFVSE